MKIQNYVQKALLIDFAVAVAGMFVLCLPAVAISAISRLAGVDLMIILTIVPLVLLGLMPYILPLGYLLAVVVTYGRLAADNEWTAIRMAGVHPFRMLMPALPLAVILGAGSWWFMAERLPVLRRQQDSVAFHALRRVITSLNPGRTELGLGKFNLIAGYRDGDDFLEAVIQVPSMDGVEARMIAARRVHFTFEGDDVVLHLQDARSVQGAFDVTSESTTVRINLEDLSTGSEKKFRTLRYKPSSQIYAELDQGGIDPKAADVMLFEIHERDAIASIYVMFMLLGVPVGLLMRRGTQLGALSVAVAFALVYYLVALRVGQELAKNHLLPPLLCAWAVNVMGILLGLLLIRKALRQ